MGSCVLEGGRKPFPDISLSPTPDVELLPHHSGGTLVQCRPLTAEPVTCLQSAPQRSAATHSAAEKSPFQTQALRGRRRYSSPGGRRSRWNLTPYTLRSAPCTLHPKPQTL